MPAWRVGDTPLPAYFIAAEGFEGAARPLIIFNKGCDGTIADMYFASAVAASRRGYHSLLFDGPGQGAMLYERGVALRPDWEVVIKSVVDFAHALPLVDAKRIALSGWSLSGHLAPRGASGELFTMRGRAEQIRCPTLITQAENDPLAAGADAFLDARTCPKTLLRFSAPRGRMAIARCRTAPCSMAASSIGWTSRLPPRPDPGATAP